MKSFNQFEYEIPVQITFRDFPSCESVRDAVLERVARLARHFDRIQRCEVIVSLPHKHDHKSLTYHVELRLHIPGENMYVSLEPAKTNEDRGIFEAIRDSFDVLERNLEAQLSKRRNFVKSHKRNLKTVEEIERLSS